MEQLRTTVRMPAELLKAIEAVRDPEEFPTLSDFVRRAVEKYVGTGHVLRGPLYGVVVSDEPFNYLSTIVIVPLSTGAKPAIFRPEISFHGKVTRALPDQLRAVDKHRLREYQGSVAGTSFFYALQEALRELLAL
ncbi:YlcI/YnfO family protein [Neomoorella thermoacetica]|uniref:YlcI/YnfO family protein n=1 Tax=Neomoorella thermoacetica TaxID=1525 RepID=UPI0008FA2C7D|nr:YlcI/YnfO family protein [Moorella thermoacetica]OIQ12564.1 PemK-like protein [Moorella thermoacetica]